jgi:hypothetical protein
MDATDEMSKSLASGSLALNGTWMSNASSMAKIDSTRPRLSIPRSSSVASMDTSDGSSTACSAMIAITFSLTLSAMTLPTSDPEASLKASGRT